MIDLFQEHCDYEANARYDYLSEAYGATARDCNEMAANDEICDMAEDLGISFKEAEERIKAFRAKALAPRNPAWTDAELDDFPF